MKKNLLFALALLLSGIGTFAQTYPPTTFSYESYVIDGYKDQLIQNPCFAHATIAGIETMYKLLYGENLNLSERVLFTCTYNSNAKGSLAEVIGYVNQYGVISEKSSDCETVYPKRNAITCTNITDEEPAEIEGMLLGIDCQQKQTASGTRYKISTESVIMKDQNGNIDNNLVKKNLMSYGPIMFTYSGDMLHAMLLIGWDNEGWKVVDSWPGKPGIKTIKYNEPYENITGQSYDKFHEACIITSITKEVYNANKWSVVTLPTKLYRNFGLGFPKIVKKTIPNPLCYNRGIEYELQGLANMTGAQFIGWSYKASPDYNKGLSITANGTKCIVSGNAADVKLCAMIKTYTGILEEIILSIGNVGVPTRLSTLNGRCVSGNYEITSKIEVAGSTGVSYGFSFNIPASSDGSYYAFSNGQYAWWVFKKFGAVNYTATVKATQTGCPSISNTQSSYMYSSYCGYSYSYKSALDSTSNILVEEGFENADVLVSPNPVHNNLTLTHIGKGTNDIRIYDLQGNLVYSIITEETVTIDVSMIPRGVYIVRYFTSEKVKPVKLILE